MAEGLTREEIEDPGLIGRNLRCHAKRFELEAYANALLQRDQTTYEDIVHCLMYLAAHQPRIYARSLCAVLPVNTS